MKNVYTHISVLNDEAFEIISKMTGDRNIYIVADTNEQISVSLINKIVKNNITIMDIKDSGDEKEFFLTLQVGTKLANADDNIYIIFPKESKINAINQYQFTSTAGEFKIIVASDFSIFEGNGQTSVPKKRTRRTRKEIEAEKQLNENENNHFMNEPEPVKPVSDLMTKTFYSKLQSLDDGITDIMQYKEKIKKSVIDADNSIGLEMVLRINLGADKSTDVYSIICPAFSELKAIVNEEYIS